MAVAYFPWPNPEDRYLSTIDLTQSPDILTTGTDRHLALFDKPTLVDNQRGVRGIPDQLIGITRHMVKHFTCAPFRAVTTAADFASVSGTTSEIA